MGKRIVASVLLVVCIFFLASYNTQAQSVVAANGTKLVAGSPQDILAGTLRLPDPAQAGIRSQSAMIPVSLRVGQDGSAQWSGALPVDSREGVSVMLLPPAGANWQLYLTPAGGREVAASELATREPGTLGVESVQVEGEVYRVAQAAPGQWQARIVATGTAATEQGFLLLSNAKSPYRLHSHLSSYNLLVGQEISFVSYLYDDVTGPAAAPLAGAIHRAEVSLTTPGRQTMRLTGSRAATMAADGSVRSTFVATEPGSYVAQVTVEGTTPDGQPFVRTAEHLFPVVRQAMSVAAPRSLSATMVGGTQLRMELPVTVNSGGLGTVQAMAELWGTGANGARLPIAWIGGMVAPEQRGTQAVLPLTVDARWVGLAGARAPFELRNVRIHDVATHIPMSQVERVAVRMPRLPASALRASGAPTQEMLMGARPTEAQLQQGLAATAIAPSAYVGGRKLLLVHGYCSGGVWPTGDFTNYSVFQDFNQNRTHDQFAQRIRDHGSQFDSFGVVAHSQGGAAALHLYTYYWSGLDNAVGTRLIQSVGTPYQGTALAGNLALLGGVFGVGCGTNWDLTYDGASLWLSGIPSWARSKVYYHTTSFTDRWWAYDYCNMASDVVLSDPEDGTTEKWAGQLSGANNMGHKTGWCHTAGMRDPAQYTDRTRNLNMSSNAAR